MNKKSKNLAALLPPIGMSSFMGPLVTNVFDKLKQKNDVWVTIRHDRYNELMDKEVKLFKLEKKLSKKKRVRK